LGISLPSLLLLPLSFLPLLFGNCPGGEGTFLFPSAEMGEVKREYRSSKKKKKKRKNPPSNTTFERKKEMQ
jgi:hypothetical protein